MEKQVSNGSLDQQFTSEFSHAYSLISAIFCTYICIFEESPCDIVSFDHLSLDLTLL